MNKYQKAIHVEVVDLRKHHGGTYYQARRAINYWAKQNRHSRMKVLCCNCDNRWCESESLRKMAYCSQNS